MGYASTCIPHNNAHIVVVYVDIKITQPHLFSNLPKSPIHSGQVTVTSDITRVIATKEEVVAAVTRVAVTVEDFTENAEFPKRANICKGSKEQEEWQ